MSKEPLVGAKQKRDPVLDYAFLDTPLPDLGGETGEESLGLGENLAADADWIEWTDGDSDGAQAEKGTAVTTQEIEACVLGGLIGVAEVMESWLGDETDALQLKPDYFAGEQERSWEEDEKEALLVANLGDYIDDIEVNDLSDDRGEEGPLTDQPGAWDEGDADERRFSSSDWDDAVGPAGESAFDLQLASPALVLDTQFLGPLREGGGKIAAGAFCCGSPLAVGSGLFMLGADGMLHGIRGFSEETNLASTSLFVHAKDVYIGTQDRGLLRTRYRDNAYEALNSWHSQGLACVAQGGLETVSSAITVYGRQTQAGCQLFVATSSGLLYCSDDRGCSWRTLAVPGKCAAFCPGMDDEAIWILTRTEGRVPCLWRSRDLETWNEETSFRQQFAKNGGSGKCSLAVANSRIAIGFAEGNELFISADQGASWQTQSGFNGITALAIDPHSPRFLAVATRGGRGVGSLVEVMDEGYENWREVFWPSFGDRVEEQEGPAAATAERLITGLCLQSGRTRELMVLTTAGVFLVTLPCCGVSH